MGQITIYLDSELERLVRQRAAERAQSVSSYIADTLKGRSERLGPGFWDQIGVIADMPLAEEFRAFDAPDAPREWP